MTQWVIGTVVLVLLAVVVNGVYQIVRKPSELFFPVSGALGRSAADTWRDYSPLFTTYSTGVMTPDLLAAMAQVEGAGNPVARTYWRWSWTLHPFQVYRPASSAVGMYQITDGTFLEAKRYCIRDHGVLQAGTGGGRACWSNRLYSRIVPAQAMELTSAYLDRTVTDILARHRLNAVSLRRKQSLAAVIHLCGAGAGDAYARRGLRLSAGERCGDHEVGAYVARIRTLQGTFVRLAAASNPR